MLLSLAWCVLLMPLFSFGSNKDQDNICDNGVFEAKKDLGGEEDWKCVGEKYPARAYYLPAGEGYCNITEHLDASPQCMWEDIQYHIHPPSYGHYRYVVPQFGEYHYLPPQRWLHTLKGGGVAFLYHPCANQEQVDLLKGLARRCLSSYVITPYPHLTEEKPLAVVTWGCVYQMNWVSTGEIIEWLLNRHITFTSGRSDKSSIVYTIGLLEPKDPETFDPQCLDLTEEEAKDGGPDDRQHNTPSSEQNEGDDATSPPQPCKSSPDSETSTPSNSSSSNQPSKCSVNSVHITLRQHSTGLVVLAVLLCGVLMGCIVLLLLKGVYSLRQRRTKHHRYKSVSRYFPFTYGKQTTDVIIPELGPPKSGLAERETLLNESDEDEL